MNSAWMNVTAELLISREADIITTATIRLSPIPFEDYAQSVVVAHPQPLSCGLQWPFSEQKSRKRLSSTNLPWCAIYPCGSCAVYTSESECTGQVESQLLLHWHPRCHSQSRTATLGESFCSPVLLTAPSIILTVSCLCERLAECSRAFPIREDILCIL